jgi:hypothetical protein
MQFVSYVAHILLFFSAERLLKESSLTNLNGKRLTDQSTLRRLSASRTSGHDRFAVATALTDQMIKVPGSPGKREQPLRRQSFSGVPDRQDRYLSKIFKQRRY